MIPLRRRAVVHYLELCVREVGQSKQLLELRSNFLRTVHNDSRVLTRLPTWAARTDENCNRILHYVITIHERASLDNIAPSRDDEPYRFQVGGKSSAAPPHGPSEQSPTHIQHLSFNPPGSESNAL